MATTQNQRNPGFTLVELLVVIFIIGVLVALLLPAVQAAREAARRVTCKNHVHQLALAAIVHHEQIGHFPTGGWSRKWIGDSDRGFGKDQPGGWAFSVLPFLEEKSLYDLAGDGHAEVITPRQMEGAKRLIGAALPVMYCPSRRQAVPYPIDQRPVPPGSVFINADQPDASGRIDYAISVGDTHWDDVFNTSRPTSLRDAATLWRCNDSQGNLATQVSCVGADLLLSRPSPLTGSIGLNGVGFEISEIAIRHVTDGASKTYLLGEKDLGLPEGEISRWRVDYTWASGATYDNARSGAWHPVMDRGGNRGFGSAHPHGCHMAYCDGSVRVVGYDVDLRIHQAAANRHDGMVFGD